MSDQLGLFVPHNRRVPKFGTQQHKVLHWLRDQGSITARDAMGFGCYRLAARIMELRDMGYRIETETEKHAKGTHARYRLRV